MWLIKTEEVTLSQPSMLQITQNQLQKPNTSLLSVKSCQQCKDEFFFLCAVWLSIIRDYYTAAVALKIVFEVAMITGEVLKKGFEISETICPDEGKFPAGCRQLLLFKREYSVETIHTSQPAVSGLHCTCLCFCLLLQRVLNMKTRHLKCLITVLQQMKPR